MICQSCKTDLIANGLQSYGRNLTEHLCCVCWFALLENDLPEYTQEDFFEDEGLHSPFLSELEDNGYIILGEGKDTPERIFEWLNNGMKTCNQEIDSLRSEMDCQYQRKQWIEEMKAVIEDACPHLKQAKTKEKVLA